jgi:WD40 repeat protein
MKQSSFPGHSKDVTDIALARGGSACISASNDGTFKVLECDTAEQCFTVRGAV